MGRLAKRSWLAMAVSIVVVFAPAVAEATVRTTTWPSDSVRVSIDTSRLYGATRYDTAAEIARAGFPGWTDVSHVIIASGLTRSLADPLAAGSLCWAYDAPMLLVTDESVPDAARVALEEIVSTNTTVTALVVGGTGAVSDACVAELESILGDGNVERPFAGHDRYHTASLIAEHVSEVASDTPGLTLPDVALIANGDRGYYDALALSAVSARTGAPVLLVMRDSVPSATSLALASLAASEVIIGGGTGVVSDGTYTALGGTERWCGATRYGTAASIAENAVARGWFDADTLGIAATLPDALVGATLCAREGAPILFTASDRVSAELAVFVEEREDEVVECVVFGGPAAVKADTVAQLEGAPASPQIVGMAQGSLTAKYARLMVSVGVNTSECRVYSGDTLVASRAVPSYGCIDFGNVAMPSSGGKLRVEVGNPEGGESAVDRTITRLAYPASTSIVIDKSDFRLYWVKGDVLIKAYPIAIGRVGMETPVATWKILSKYYTDPSGVYGPRKMRLYRQYGSSYVYTAYGVHGTNEPWVIGTKASHGCIRLYNSDILDLFPQVPLGTLVQTRE